MSVLIDYKGAFFFERKIQQAFFSQCGVISDEKALGVLAVPAGIGV